MYRCEICRTVSKPGTPQLRHVVVRTVLHSRVSVRQSRVRGEVEREIPVCSSCQVALGDGVSLAELYRKHARPREVPSRSAPQPAPLFGVR